MRGGGKGRKIDDRRRKMEVRRRKGEEYNEIRDRWRGRRMRKEFRGEKKNLNKLKVKWAVNIKKGMMTYKGVGKRRAKGWRRRSSPLNVISVTDLLGLSKSAPSFCQFIAL
jgi:hypothetical protein